MNQADIFYRAFLEYRNETLGDAKCKRLRGAIAAASPENDRLEAVRSHCIIEEDWVNRIYEGLPFIEKAIREERQFITQQGEVVPIEKAKRVSKGSVEHLARHSDMITHEPEPGADIVPDELYVVERLSDFAVYENRFLYMLLCYLRDFIDYRYSKIIELGNTYRAKFAVDKVVKIGKRVLKIKIDMSDEAKEDPFGFVSDVSDGLLKRIEDERHVIAALLLTPLMRIVSKSPMLKPPVTRTNALRMNNNFKNALALYDFIAAYTADGFRIENITKSFTPLADKMADEFADIIALDSFLVYQYGKELKPALRVSYDIEEERRRAENDERHRALLRDMKKHLEETGEGIEEYVLRLEERNHGLEDDRRRLGEAREQIASLESSVIDYRRRQNELLGEIDHLHEENARQRDEFEREKQEMNDDFAQQKQQLSDECDAKIAERDAENRRLSDECDAKIAERDAENRRLSDECEAKLAERDAEKRRLVEQHSAHIRDIRDECDNRLATERNSFEQQLGQSREECSRLSDERQALWDERVELRAELHAQKQINGSISEEGDFSDKVRFSELEKELAALQKLRNAQWKKAKKKIRDRILWKKGEPEDGDNAEEIADNAEEAVNNAEEAANNAEEAANNAEEAANNAEEAVNNAEEAVNNAEEAANNAEEIADNAEEAVNNAEEAVNNAEEAVNNAEEAANNAEEAANNAEEAVNNAEEAANNAEEAINNAEEAANNAEEAANNAEESVNNAEEAAEGDKDTEETGDVSDTVKRNGEDGASDDNK